MLAALSPTFGLYAAERRIEDDPWRRAETIRRGIEEPVFPDRVFHPESFGAVADGRTLCTEALSAAIDACNRAGGGTVEFAPGRYLTGAIHLKSNVRLYVPKGATLLFSRDPADYLPVVLSWWEGMPLMNYSPFVYAYGQTNIALTGGGTLDGQADFEYWWPWRGPKPWSGTHSGTSTGWKPGMPNGIEDRERLINMMEDGVPAEQRLFGAGHYLRPCMIQPIRCERVLFEGLTVKNAPFWAVHPVLCHSVTARGLTLLSKAAPNGDGIDPESCDGVLIEDCDFFTGDDCIAIKSGRDADGRRLDKPCQNILVRNCHFQTERAAIVLGSEGTGGIRNVFVENISFGDIWRAIRLKANTRRGAVYENVHIRDVRLGTVHDTVFEIDANYKNEQGPYPSMVRNLSLAGLECDETGRAFVFNGSPESTIEDIRLKNIEVRTAREKSLVQHVENLSMDNVRVNGKVIIA